MAKAKSKARVTPKGKTPKTYKGKSTKPGGGGQFAKAVDAMTAKGLPKREAQAIAAKQGRRKYGAKKMATFAAQGRKRAASKRKGK
jgi:hypothetical protein